MPETTADPADVEISIILPMHNEVGHAENEIKRIRQAMDADGRSYELIVIDDASTDGTTDLLERGEGYRLIALRPNRGSGYARRVGTRAARGEVVVWTDADMTYPNDRIPQLVDELDGHDQVVGARTSEEGTHRWARIPAKWFIRMLAQYLTATRIPDLNSGFRAFRRSTALPYLKLLPTGFSCVTTITLAFLSNGHSVHYVPIEYKERAGESKFHWRRDTARYGLQVVRMIMTFNPLRFFMPVGGLLMATAFGKILYDVIDKDFRISSNAIILTIMAFQVIAIGLLADLVSRVTSDEPDTVHTP